MGILIAGSLLVLMQVLIATGHSAISEEGTCMGTGSARSMAAGVSKATVPTMAGMVGALSGVFASIWLSRKADREVEMLQDNLTMDH